MERRASGNLLIVNPTLMLASITDSNFKNKRRGPESLVYLQNITGLSCASLTEAGTFFHHKKQAGDIGDGH